MTCSCGGPIKVSLDIDGGGRCSCGDYCYCSPPEITIDYSCGAAKRCRNKNFNHLPSDRYGIEQMIDNYLAQLETV